MKRSFRSIGIIAILLAGLHTSNALPITNPIQHPRRTAALAQAFLIAWGAKVLLSSISMSAFKEWTDNKKDIPVDTKNALDVLAEVRSQEEMRLLFKTAQRSILQILKTYPEVLLPILTANPSIPRERFLKMISTAITTGSITPFMIFVIQQTHEKFKDIGNIALIQAYKKLKDIANYTFSDLFTIDHTYKELKDYPLVPHSTMPYCGPQDPLCLEQIKHLQPQDILPWSKVIPLAPILSELLYPAVGYLLSEYAYPIAKELLDKYHILYGATAPPEAAWIKGIEKIIEKYVNERLFLELKNSFLEWVVTFSNQTEKSKTKPLAVWINETKVLEQELQEWKNPAKNIGYGYRFNIATKIYNNYQKFYDALLS